MLTSKKGVIMDLLMKSLEE